jgi:cytochrome c-type biogenesis protein CcsB
MTQIEILLFWITLFVYVVSFCLYLFGYVGRRDRIVTYAVRFLWLGFAVHSALGIVRWLAGGHPPVTDVYELNLTGTWFTILIFIVFKKMDKIDRSVGLVVVPISFLVLGFGFMSRTDAVPLGPAFKSPWLIVHVIFAWLAFGCYAVATGAAVIQLLKSKKTPSRSLQKTPEPEILDLTSYRFVVLGFINQAVMIVTGAIWAKQLWGQYWSWDPLETWSLIAFLFYAFYLHARSFLKWKMKRAAWLAVIGLVVLIISFWGVGLFAPSVHPEI